MSINETGIDLPTLDSIELQPRPRRKPAVRLEKPFKKREMNNVGKNASRPVNAMFLTRTETDPDVKVRFTTRSFDKESFETHKTWLNEVRGEQVLKSWRFDTPMKRMDALLRLKRDVESDKVKVKGVKDFLNRVKW
jgi:hypothetical protein